MCESERHTGRLEIPKSLPKRDHCIFYRAWGIARGFTGLPRIESPRAFYHPVAAGVTPADPRFSFLFAARDEPRRSSILRVQYPAPLAILPSYRMLNFGNLPFMKSMIHDEYVTG